MANSKYYLYRISLAIVCCSILMNIYAQEKKPVTRMVHTNGNVIELLDYSDTFEMLDMTTNEVREVIENPDGEPVKINGGNIYTAKDAIDKKPVVDEGTVRQYILNRIGGRLTGLGDGAYAIRLNNIILDEKGRIAYYNLASVEKSSITRMPVYSWKKTDDRTQERISALIRELVAAMPAYSPVTVYKNPVPFRLTAANDEQILIIKNGTASVLTKK